MNMKHQQYFLSKLENLIECFPSLKSKAKIERIYHFLKEIPENGIDEIIFAIIDNFKYAPTPHDFHEAAILWKRKNNYYPVIDAQFTKIECDFCFETGVVKIEHNTPDGFQKLVRCSCSYGGNNADKLPRWTNDLSAGFKKVPLTASWFNPQIIPYEAEKSINEKIYKKMHEWRKQVRISENYWSGLGYKHTQE